IRIDAVLDGQPEAAAVAEEPQREHDAERKPDSELRGCGKVGPAPEQEVPGDGHEGGDRVVDVDRADPVALRALEPEVAHRADLVHREPAAVERCAAAPRAPQPETAPDARRYPPQRLRHSASRSR